MRTAAFRATVGAFFVACSLGLGLAATRLGGGWAIPLVALIATTWLALLLATAETLGLGGPRTLGRVLVSVLIILVVVEGGLRLTDLIRRPTRVSYYLWRPGSQALFHPAPGVLPGITYAESRFTIGPEGIRARPTAENDRAQILAVGGSTTEELYVDDSDTWSAIVERRLTSAERGSVWVGNAGKSGLDSSDHIVLMRTLGREIRPDVTVVLVGWNDMTHSLLGVLDAVDWDKGMRQFDSARGGELFVDGRPRITGLRMYWSARGLWRLVRQWIPGAERPFVLLEDGRSNLASIAARTRAPTSDTIPARLASDLDRYESRLRQLELATKAAGSRLVLLTQPSIYRDGAPNSTTLAIAGGGAWIPGSATFYSPDAIAGMIAAYNDATLRVCREEHLACLDLASKIAPDAEHFYDDVHLNTAGSKEVGVVVADFLATIIPSSIGTSK